MSEIAVQLNRQGNLNIAKAAHFLRHICQNIELMTHHFDSLLKTGERRNVK